MAIASVFVNTHTIKLAQLAADNLTAGKTPANMKLSYFQVGEGAFQVVDGYKVPIAPSATATALDATGANGKFRYQKSLSPSDISDDGAGTLTVVCKLTSTESGLDGQGLVNPPNPELFEVGVFDADNDLVLYGTYDQVVKTAGTEVVLTLISRYGS
tara:strand:+ start:949 stop:1419 length:471 start_codon:yes stop_codon:yes gene_type:complete